MSTSDLLPGEQIVMSSDKDVLTLTNLRVKHEVANSGSSAYSSIPLTKVSACALVTKKYPILLLIAALCFLGVIGANGEGAKFAAGIGAIGFVAAYFFTRNGQLEIFSDAGFSIAVPTKGLKHEEARKFVEAVALELTKLK